MFRKKFETYSKISAEQGEDKAKEVLMDGYPERQKKNMGPLLDNMTLYQSYEKGIPIYESFGMKMKPMDISKDDIDGLIEVHFVCPYMDMAKENGVRRPCTVICEMDMEAQMIAFPDIKAKLISCQADGDGVCIMKYERPKR